MLLYSYLQFGLDPLCKTTCLSVLLSSSSGLLPNAVLPPSLDHNYAQWQGREELSRAEQPHLMKKIIPAPRPKTPGEPDSPTSSPPLPSSLPPPPPLLHGKANLPHTHTLSLQSIAGLFTHVPYFLIIFSADCEDSPELPPPPGVNDNRQCVLCLKYGDENTNVSQTFTHVILNPQHITYTGCPRIPTSNVSVLCHFRRAAGCCTSVRMSGPM